MRQPARTPKNISLLKKPVVELFDATVAAVAQSPTLLRNVRDNYAAGFVIGIGQPCRPEVPSSRGEMCLNT